MLVKKEAGYTIADIVEKKKISESMARRKMRDREPIRYDMIGNHRVAVYSRSLVDEVFARKRGRPAKAKA